jgi:uncharacterized protein YbjT (DUF2867 family)
MTGKRLLLVGATGLVGQGVLEIVRCASQVTQVTALVRRPLALADSKVRVLQVTDFSAASLAGVDLRGLDACLYCAGPLPLGMSVAAYREATVGVLARVARAYAAANPAGYLVYVSGLGADPHSRLMPARVKGEAEQALRQIGIAHTSLRPGVVRPVLGERSPHAWRRWAYGLGMPMLALAAAVLPSVFTTTQAIGGCMLRLCLAGGPRPEVLENGRIAADEA